MEKLQLKKYLLFSLIIFFAGCGYKFIHQKEKKIYIETISNHTFQPQLEIYLDESLRDVINSYPEFSIVNSKKYADCSLKINLLKLVREPLFFSGEKTDEIVNARFNVKFEVILKEKGKLISQKILSEKLSFSLARDFEEEKILKKLSDEIAVRVYFWLVENENKLLHKIGKHKMRRDNLTR